MSEDKITPIANSPFTLSNSPFKLDEDLDLPIKDLFINDVPQPDKPKKLNIIPKVNLLLKTSKSFIPVKKLTRSDNEIDPILWADNDPPTPNENNSIYVYFGCIGDGNCLFHSLLKGATDVYPETYPYKTVSEKVLQMMEQVFYKKVKTREGYKIVMEFYFDDDLTFSPKRNRDNINQIYQIIDHTRFNSKATTWRYKYARLIRDNMATKYLMDDTYIQKYLYGKDPDYLSE